MGFQETYPNYPPAYPQGLGLGQLPADPVIELMMKLTQKLNGVGVPAPGGPIKPIEVTNPLNKPLQIEIVGSGAAIIRGTNGFTFADYLPPKLDRTDGQSVASRGIVYEVSGVITQSYFWTQDGPVYIPMQALEFRPNAIGQGPVRTALDGIKSGDYPYIKEIPGVVIPPMESVINLTFIYIPRVGTAPQLVVDNYQPPFVSDPLQPPVGRDNAATLDFGFATQVPTVVIVDTTTGAPTSVVYYELITYVQNGQTLSHSLYFWTDVEVPLSVRFKIQQ